MNQGLGDLLDLDGAVYRGDKLISGAKEGISVLRNRGRRILFISNKPLYFGRSYAQKLRQLGIPVKEKDVINSSLVLA